MSALRLLVTATETEAKRVSRMLGCELTAPPRKNADYLLWKNSERTTAIVATGIGPKAAEQGLLQALADLKPIGMAVGFGFAGGLTKSAKTGDLIVPVKVIFGRDEELPTDWLRMALISGLESPPFRTLLTSTKLISSPVEKAGLFAATGAEAVDMESAVWGMVCRGEGIPWAVVRVVLDSAEEPLPESFGRICDRYGRPRWGSAAVRFLFHPSDLKIALRIHRELRQGAPIVGGVLKTWLNAT